MDNKNSVHIDIFVSEPLYVTYSGAVERFKIRTGNTGLYLDAAQLVQLVAAIDEAVARLAQ